jgi:hypothetical protein
MIKKTLLLVLGLVLVLMAGPNTLQTARVSFANETPAKGDTIQASDSMFCTIDQRINGKLADRITVFLPEVLASGDSMLVYGQRLLGDNKGGGNISKNSLNSNIGASDQVRAGQTKGKDYVFGSILLGTYSYTAQPVAFTWSPKDSAACERLNIVIVDVSNGTNVLTDIDSLATSDAYVTWTMEED